MMASAGAVLSGIMWLQQLHDHRWVAPVPYGPRPRSNAQPNRPSIDYATALRGDLGDVLAGLLVRCLVGSFDELAVLEPRAGPHQGDQVGTVDRPPAALGGLQQLEHHRQPGLPGARPLGHPGAGPDRGERALDGIGGPQVHPVLRGVVEEAQQPLGLAGDLGDRLGPLDAIVGGEGVDRPLGVGAVLDPDDLVQRLAGAGVHALGQRAKNIPGHVLPAAFSRVAGKTSRSARHSPSAPSPTITTGARMPRRRRSRSSSAQSSVDSLVPSATATSSLRPSARTPTITRQHSRPWSPRRMLKWTPSAQQYTESISDRSRRWKASRSACHCSHSRVITEADRPAAEPNSSVNAGTKS